jgi:SPP1 gp7 family putative phage head morphogenesis protein
MLFRNFDGQLLMSIHSNRNIDLDKQHFERHPVIYIMDDSGDELRAVMEYRRNTSAGNPAPVVVPNPELNYGVNGWSCSSKAKNQGIANNQNGAITGNFFENWDENSFTGDIYQELEVPNGTYQIRAAAFRSGLISGGATNATTVKLFANDELCNVTNTTPGYYKVTVFVKDGRLRFGLRSEKRNFKWMGIDNVTINYFGTDSLSASDIDTASEQRIYLRSKLDGRFLNAGQSWGTQAMLTAHPLDFYPVWLNDGKCALDSRLKNGYDLHYVSSNGYLDGVMTPFTMDWVDEILEQTDFVTLYRFDRETERKAQRLIEELSETQNRDYSIDKALRFWSQQLGQYAINFTDYAELKAFEDAGIEMAEWVSVEDERRCMECYALHGQIFRVKEFPRKPHWGCRCRKKPVFRTAED